MTTKIRDVSIQCDEENNPPSTKDEVLNVRVHIQFEDQHTEYHLFNLPIDLKALREDKLKSVPVEGWRDA